MGLYTKNDEQLDIFYEIVFINRSLSKQDFYLKFIVILVLICNVFMIVKCFI